MIELPRCTCTHSDKRAVAAVTTAKHRTPSRASTPKIGVVGGGPAAVTLLDAVAQGPELPPGQLIVFEPSARLWRGRPYQADIDSIRVNSVPGDMSIRAGNGAHLQDWMSRSLATGPAYGDPFSGVQFISRAVFGDYLEQSAQFAMRSLRDRGWAVHVVRERVISAEPATGGVRLLTEGGTWFAVDHAVLCFGAGKPADPYGLAGHGGFVAEPYPTVRSLSEIEPDAEVAVLGTGLTAVDVVLALEEFGHRGRIRLLSRHGVLPGVRQRPVHHRLRHFTPERFRAIAETGRSVTLPELVGMMATELASVGESLDAIEREIHAIDHEKPVDRLRRNLSEVDSPSRAIRILQQAVPEAGCDVWPLLCADDQKRVLDAYDRTVMSLCCPMPPANAAVLLGLIESGRVELVPDVSNVRPAADGFAVETAGTTFTTRLVVNGVNARNRHTPKEASGLVRSLVSAGLVEPHDRGGIHVERATSRCTVGGVPDDRLYALGDPARGSLFFTFGIQVLVERAVDIVASIASRFPTTCSGQSLQLV